MGKILFLLFLITLISRALFLEKWLGDWDSIQLALGLHEYSVVKHQPHLPGYPIYILLGKIFGLFFRDDTLALTWMSALFGSLSIFPLYFLAKEAFNKKMALLATCFFIIIPVVWLLSVTALTDIVGLFFLILIGYLFYKYIENKTATVAVSFLAGAFIGVRFNEFPVILGLLFWVILKQRDLKMAFLQIGSLSLGIFLWLIPMIVWTGWNEFFQNFWKDGSYVVAHDLLLGESRSILGLVKAKVLMLIHLFELGFSIPLSLVFLVAFIWTLLQRKLYSENWYQFCLVWLISYSVFLSTFFNLELPRHILPLVLPIIFITVYVLGSLVKNKKSFLIIPVILLYLLAVRSYSQVSRFHNSLPATVASVLFVKQNYDPIETIIYSSFTYRNFTYYAPEFKNIDKNSNKSEITQDKTIILDHNDLKKDPILAGFEEVGTHYFSSDKDIFPKVDSIELHVLKYKEKK